MACIRVVVHAAPLARAVTTGLGGLYPVFAWWTVRRWLSHVLHHRLVDTPASGVFGWTSRGHRKDCNREGQRPRHTRLPGQRSSPVMQVDPTMRTPAATPRPAVFAGSSPTTRSVQERGRVPAVVHSVVERRVVLVRRRGRPSSSPVR